MAAARWSSLGEELLQERARAVTRTGPKIVRIRKAVPAIKRGEVLSESHACLRDVRSPSAASVEVRAGKEVVG